MTHKGILPFCLTMLYFAAVNAYDVLPSEAKRYAYYAGLDLQLTKNEYKNDWQKVFRRNQPGMNFFLGWVISDNWSSSFINKLALEFGYSTTTRKSLQISTAGNESLFGILNTSGQRIMTNARLRLKNTHLDLHLHTPIKKKWDFIMSAGLGFSRQNVRINTSTPLSNATAGIRGKTMAVGRLGVGLERVINETMAARAGLGYETLQRVKFRGVPTVNTSGAKPFKYGVNASIGVFWRF